ncbi:glycoside hydrolase family 9 protein [Hwangdonia seohaensis]|uniref:Glycoside hydrolase family 9 protein n=1 Tax=Hwangdonia seohaensis TaxID=1240727 RepID=A0ABW3RDM8_9FLAO|nr:glycoside hydrolase family 9 protein [Hwangdonia seohaensis]
MRHLALLFVIAFLNLGCSEEEHQSWIRINQMGYQPNTIKVAVIGSKDNITVKEFTLHNSKTDAIVASFNSVEAKGWFGPFETSYRLDFSDFNEVGSYYIMAKNTKSPVFRIDDNVYDGTADFLLKYMRQQRCGFNPYLKDSCHVDDGFIIYHPEKPDGSYIDVAGGWHDATDYLQYTATSANAIYQLLYAYRENPEAFGDTHQAYGLEGSNGIPDVIDEAKFGMDWLIKMNPSSTEYYNQIADDRDHAGYRLPNKDSVVYHPEFKGRPVYFVNGEIQGLFKNKNRTTGVSSTAGKFASSFGIGAEVLAPFFPEYTEKLTQKAKDAYAFGKTKPGTMQTAPATSPYFYEEDNWYDDMELAAATLYKLTNDKTYYSEALNYASSEKVTPWMGQDTAKHYQYYPFYNAGHNELALIANTDDKKTVTDYYKFGLEAVAQRGKDNPFLIGVPFIWCSNNLVTATLTQAKAYRELTGDDTYLEMEAALRDWLFGCNPWGTSMIVGLPEGYGDSPIYPHSSLNHLHGYQTDGGLVDGPVYGSIYNNLKGLQLLNADPYADFQSDFVVYHDDVGDYSTNEPTMDGTACLVFYLASLEADVKKK